MVKTDDNIFLCLGDWSGAYNNAIQETKWKATVDGLLKVRK